MRKGPGLFLKLAMLLGFAFLYAPIVILVIYSFNESKLVTVWAGFSTRWYVSLWQNQGLIDAAKVSVSVALTVSTLAAVLGVMAGYALARVPRFFGRTMFSGMVLAPLVMPDVIIGLSLLLTFISMSLDRGFLTIVIAHATFSICYVTVVVQARLAGFDTSVEEAAQDLGARPATVFFRITLPLIAPAVIAGWLLSFTLSLDDLVIASFASGAGSTTLPMKIFSSVRLGVTPEINAIATILIGLVATGTVVYSLLLKRAEAQRIRAEIAMKGNSRVRARTHPTGRVAIEPLRAKAMRIAPGPKGGRIRARPRSFNGGAGRARSGADPGRAV